MSPEKFRRLLYLSLPAVATVGILLLLWLKVIDEETTKLLIPIFGSFVSAFYGASFAVYLQKRQEDEKNREKLIAAVNQTLFSLVRRMEGIQSIKRDCIDKFRNSTGRNVEIMAFFLPTSWGDIPITALAPLLTSNVSKLLLDLAKYEQEFEVVLELVIKRNKLHEALQEVLGPVNKQELTIKEIEKIAGPTLWAQLNMLTNQLIPSIDGLLDSQRDLIQRINKAIKVKFPKQPIINYVEMAR